MGARLDIFLKCIIHKKNVPHVVGKLFLNKKCLGIFSPVSMAINKMAAK